MKPVAWLRLVVAALLALGALCPLQARAQVPARFYWKSLSGGSAVPLIFESLSGNTNPFDPAHTVMAGANFDATMALAGYAHTFTLLDRSALAALILPMGRISGEVAVDGRTSSQSTSGYGDPMIEFNVNLLGPPAQQNLVHALRYEPGFSVDLLADLAVPIGEYDSSQPLNIGQNRWYGRLGAPIVWQLGAWVPGRRTTLEFLPAVWLFGKNDNFVGQTLETDPLFQLDAHLTRDFTEHFWGSVDSTYMAGGKSSVSGVSGDSLNNVGVGFTLGYQINDNISLTAGYMATVNDSEPTDLQMDGFRISFTYGWHKIVEGQKRLKSEE